MKLFNFSSNQKRPNQKQLGKSGNGGFSLTGMGFEVIEFDLYSQIKDFRTDLLNGTNWFPVDSSDLMSFSYIQFLNVISKYGTAIFNDFNKYGFAVFARIEDKVFYISHNNYTKSGDKIKVKGFEGSQVFEFSDPNFFCGEKTIFEKCEAYQKLYNISLSCQKNGMSKSGFVTVLSPKTPSGVNTALTLTNAQITEEENRISNSHGVANSEQTNIMIMSREMNFNSIMYDFSKLGILETKKLCEEFVCSKMGVPYVLLPSSGQTFSNYEQANDILMANHSRYCEYFAKFAKRELGFDIDYLTIEKNETKIVQI